MTPEQADLLIEAVNTLTRALRAELTWIYAVLLALLFFKNMGGKHE